MSHERLLTGGLDMDRLQGLDLLATAVLVLNWRGLVVHANQAAEQLFETSRFKLIGQAASRMFIGEQPIESLLAEANADALGQRRQMLEVRRDKVRQFGGSYRHQLVQQNGQWKIRLQRVDMFNAQASYDYVIQAWV